MADTKVYLSGGRIQGRSDDALTTAVPQTSWKELGRSTLSSAGDVLDSGIIAAKDNLMILVIGYKSGSASTEKLQFNADTEDNYSERHSENGGNDSTSINQDHIELSIDGEDDEFTVLTVRNTANREKLVIGHTIARQSGTGAGNSPTRWELVGKWANTSNQITRVQVTNPYGGDLDTGSELVVLGCDDDEADSGTDFWQELGTDTLTSADQISSGTIAAKKYIFGEFHATGADNSGSRPRLRFNNDTGNNYASRFCNNGGSDESPSTSYGSMYMSESDIDEGCFATFFIINVSNKEKLIIYESMRHSSSGGGVPCQRFEGVGKWANTSAQITEIDVVGSNTPSYPFHSGTTIRVWGSD